MALDSINAGWKPKARNSFATLIGPILERREDGQRVFGLMAEPQHGNYIGVVHGGVLMALADQALGEMALDAIDGKRCVTIQLNSHFLALAKVGEFIEARGEITRLTRSMIFMRGMLSVEGREIAACDGIWKILNPP